MTPQQQFEVWIAAHAMKNPEMRFTECVVAFIKKMGIDPNDNDNLKDFPLVPARYSGVWHCTVRRYFCGYIVGGSDALYAKDQTPIKLAMWLHGKKCSSNPTDAKRIPSADKEVRKTRRDFARAVEVKEFNRTDWDAAKKSNWKVCK